MSLLLKGREMPEECCGCPVEYDGRCRLLDYQDTPYDGRLDECPLVVFDTDDVAPVVHGHWGNEISVREHDDVNGGYFITRVVPCSNCGYEIAARNKTKFCPHCGVKMDKARERNEV